MPTEPRVVAVIPARWESSRFPGKPLADISGKSMVRRVVEQVSRARRVSEVIVATDDERIVAEVVSFGGKAVMTSPDHLSGTDRVAEAARSLDCQVVVNVQGDEPAIPPENVDLAIEPFMDDPQLKVSSLMTPIASSGDLLDPNVCKVVADKNGFALYFSRAPIPFHRDSWEKVFSNNSLGSGGLDYSDNFQHIGLYAYSRECLQTFCELPPSRLESIEKLEQLRLLENGIPIKMMKTNRHSVGVDCPEDIAKVLKFF